MGTFNVARCLICRTTSTWSSVDGARVTEGVGRRQASADTSNRNAISWRHDAMERQPELIQGKKVPGTKNRRRANTKQRPIARSPRVKGTYRMIGRCRLWACPPDEKPMRFVVDV